MIAILALALPVQAEITPLKVSKSIINKTKANAKKIKSAHSEIEHQLNEKEVRFLILFSTFTNKDREWVLLEEGESFFVFRWDNSDSYMDTKIEFDKKYIQLKYVKGNPKYKCKYNKAGICYGNHKQYYKLMKNLRNTLKDNLVNKES